MIDRMVAVLALAIFAAMVATIPYFVPDIDLIIVTAVVVAMAGYDFFLELRRGKGD